MRGRVRRIAPNPLSMAKRESIQIWTPLYDRMIQLFPETVNVELPTIQPDPDGRCISPETKRLNMPPKSARR